MGGQWADACVCFCGRPRPTVCQTAVLSFFYSSLRFGRRTHTFLDVKGDQANNEGRSKNDNDKFSAVVTPLHESRCVVMYFEYFLCGSWCSDMKRFRLLCCYVLSVAHARDGCLGRRWWSMTDGCGWLITTSNWQWWIMMDYWWFLIINNVDHHWWLQMVSVGDGQPACWMIVNCLQDTQLIPIDDFLPGNWIAVQIQ